MQQRAALLALHIEGEAFLVAVDQVGLVVPGPLPAAAFARRQRQQLKTHNARPEIGQKGRPQRGAEQSRQIDYDYVIKRTAHLVFLVRFGTCILHCVATARATRGQQAAAPHRGAPQWSN